MEEPVVGRTRKRARSTPLRCYIVDDHCDALSKIHIAIRRGSLPFKGLSALHFDAHPDLMVTPDMPAETCFSPHALYDTLAEAEGGIAEWILPLVYQVSKRNLKHGGIYSSCCQTPFSGPSISTTTAVLAVSARRLDLHQPPLLRRGIIVPVRALPLFLSILQFTMGGRLKSTTTNLSILHVASRPFSSYVCPRCFLGTSVGVVVDKARMGATVR